MFETTATDLPRLMNCNGSRFLPSFNNQEISDRKIRDEGNAAHWLANQCLSNGLISEDFLNQKAPNGIYITDDIIENTDVYINHILNRQGKNFIEHDTSYQFNEIFSVAGRSDNITELSDQIYIDDLKFGYGIIEPENNWTLISHAIGHHGLEFFHQNSKAPDYIFTIIQPRAKHSLGSIREWRITFQELKILFDQLVLTLSNLTDLLNTGSHCRKCPSILNCPAATMAGLNAVDVSEMTYIDEIDDQSLSYMIDLFRRAEKAINDKLSSYEELAKHRINSGKLIENFTTEKSQGNITWKPGVDAEIIKLLSGVDPSNAKLPTPGQARKLIKQKGGYDLVIDNLTYKPQKGTKLVRVDVNKKAAKLFK